MKQRLEVRLIIKNQPAFVIYGDRGLRGAVKNLSYVTHNQGLQKLPLQLLEPLSEIRTTDELYKRLTKIANSSESNNYEIKSEIKPYQR